MIAFNNILRTSVLVLVIFFELASAQYNLELLQVVFRHGERIPRKEEMYPKDPYNVSIYEPLEFGELTNLGKMREFRIGEMLRKNYAKFLGDTYHTDDIYGVSTEIDRTRMSLQLVLAGLYPPSPNQAWNKHLAWMPIPTAYVPKKLDTLLRPQICPAYKHLLETVRNSDEVRKKASGFKDLYTFLSAKAGLNLKTPEEVAELFHLLSSQKALNLRSPSWCTPEVFKKIEAVVKLDYEIRSYNKDLKRLNGGMLVKKWIENMNIGGGRERVAAKKIYLYSAHELNIAALSKVHGFSEPSIPGYGSAIIFEKLRDKSGKLYVRLLLWTGVTEQTIVYKLSGCDEICPIDKYLKIMKDVIPSNKEANCVWHSVTKEELRTYLESG